MQLQVSAVIHYHFTVMGNQRNRTLVGAWLVVWGLLLLLVSNHVLIGWDNIWPCILIVTGVVMLRVFQARLTFGVVFAASWAILLGAFLTAFSSGLVHWGALRTWWPAIPFIIGTSFIVASAAVPRTNAGSVIGALVIFMSTASFLYEKGTISDRVASPFLRFWPIVFVLAGFILMRRNVTARAQQAAAETTPRANPYDVGALSADVENEIIRRVRTAGSPQAAAVALVRELKNRFERFTWVGIYRMQDGALVLDDAEYLGLAPEHRHIELSEGVCGAAARERETQVVPDVCNDPRYLSCSPTVKSEIVVPIFSDGEVIGVLDIDSNDPDAFSDDDRRFLETLVGRASRLIRPAHVSAA
ncbi:MAG TPA: GAF domain-containing protein [Candidatus Krumholzibacteria bacterium]|nr:GAF domain-containing protein [Candidatus Krumholzibacteria bacterium]